MNQRVDDLKKTVYQTTCTLTTLSKELEFWERSCPHLFWKPLAEMGASDKLKVSTAIITIAQISIGEE